MQLINDFKGVAAGKNVMTVEASYLQNGIRVPHMLVITVAAIPKGQELLL